MDIPGARCRYINVVQHAEKDKTKLGTFICHAKFEGVWKYLIFQKILCWHMPSLIR